MGNSIDLSGKVFGNLLVIRKSNTGTIKKYECLCVCGNNVTLKTEQLKNGTRKCRTCCGCTKIKETKFKTEEQMLENYIKMDEESEIYVKKIKDFITWDISTHEEEVLRGVYAGD